MNENDYKNFLTVYQQKSSDLFNQVVALESRLLTSNQLIEGLTNKVNQLKEEIDSLKLSKQSKSKLSNNSNPEEQ